MLHCPSFQVKRIIAAGFTQYSIRWAVSCGEEDRARIGELQRIESRKSLFEQVGRYYDEGFLLLMRERLYLCSAKTENERLHHE